MSAWTGLSNLVPTRSVGRTSTANSSFGEPPWVSGGEARSQVAPADHRLGLVELLAEQISDPSGLLRHRVEIGDSVGLARSPLYVSLAPPRGDAESAFGAGESSDAYAKDDFHQPMSQGPVRSLQVHRTPRALLGFESSVSPDGPLPDAIREQPCGRQKH